MTTTIIDRNKVKKHIIENIDVMINAADIDVNTNTAHAMGGDVTFISHITVTMEGIPVELVTKEES